MLCGLGIAGVIAWELVNKALSLAFDLENWLMTLTLKSSEDWLIPAFVVGWFDVLKLYYLPRNRKKYR